MESVLKSRQFESDAEIVRVAEGLLNRSLPKAEWTHEAHFAATMYLQLSAKLLVERGAFFGAGPEDLGGAGFAGVGF